MDNCTLVISLLIANKPCVLAVKPPEVEKASIGEAGMTTSFQRLVSRAYRESASLRVCTAPEPAPLNKHTV